jgi:hypothetical protein
MSIHDSTFDNSTEIQIGDAAPSREPVPKGEYPCVIIQSSYDETSRDVVYTKDKEVVRPVHDYRENTDSPLTPEERSRGYFVDKSGTYVWLLLKLTMPDCSERLSSVRPNWINVLRPPNDDRAALKEIRDAIGGPSIQFRVGEPATVMHERPFIVKLNVKEKRGSAGILENWVDGARPIQSRAPQAGQVLPGGAEVIDVISSQGPPPDFPRGFNDKGLF